MRIAIACVTGVLAAHALVHAERGAVRPGNAAEAIERFLSTPSVPVTSYRVAGRWERS